jgi:hypothetical protein
VTLLPEAGFGGLADPHVLAAIADDCGLALRHIIDLAKHRTSRAPAPVRTA